MHINSLYLAQDLEHCQSSVSSTSIIIVVIVVKEKEGQRSCTHRGEPTSPHSASREEGTQLLLRLLDSVPNETPTQLLHHHFCAGASLPWTPNQLWRALPLGERLEELPLSPPGLTPHLSPVLPMLSLSLPLPAFSISPQLLLQPSHLIHSFYCLPLQPECQSQ